jgi:surfeit locus 1 family protein
MRIRIGALSFEPGLVATIAAALFIALTAWLGNWQTNRAEEKRGRQALFEARMAEAPLRLTGSVESPEPLMYRRVEARGEWLPDRQLFVDNRIVGGRAGFHVITPLRLEGGPAVLLVNRGWIARTADYPRPPAVAAPAGPARVSGVATRPPARFLELSRETVSRDVWQNLSVERFRERTGLDALPVVVLADTPGEGLAAVREVPDAGIAKHREYALTWYLLALTTLVMWIALNLRKES